MFLKMQPSVKSLVNSATCAHFQDISVDIAIDTERKQQHHPHCTLFETETQGLFYEKPSI